MNWIYASFKAKLFKNMKLLNYNIFKLSTLLLLDICVFLNIIIKNTIQIFEIFRLRYCCNINRTAFARA